MPRGKSVIFLSRVWRDNGFSFLAALAAASSRTGADLAARAWASKSRRLSLWACPRPSSGRRLGVEGEGGVLGLEESLAATTPHALGGGITAIAGTKRPLPKGPIIAIGLHPFQAVPTNVVIARLVRSVGSSMGDRSWGACCPPWQWEPPLRNRTLIPRSSTTPVGFIASPSR